ncbi:hypothetical protein SAMN05444064_13827 [Pseudomonas syringae]|uniref:hypothetical protein n=1 Tax=Pseudomonas syringae TaxID=317 RepID=UPI0008945B58|nr:hypothetical protein [Pseudomonas syringae]SDX74215.1 hypothetical protein SAMN05444514_13927 [Pseudomonas syringae]SFM81925.1 hypothetical protein SAMN05444064_13827 [Pseudomonas syringae]
MTMADQATSGTSLHSANSLRSKLYDGILALTIAIAITFAVSSIIPHALEKPIPVCWYGIGCVASFFIVYIRLRSIKVISAFESWDVLALVANSKPAQFLITVFSIVPMLVSIAKSADMQQQIPFTVYLYWASGLTLFIFLLLFKVTAPVVYRYKSYQDVLDQYGGLEVLREELLKLQAMASSGKAPFDKAHNHTFLAQDIAAIQWLRITDKTEAPELYFLIRKYSTGLKMGWRKALTPLLFVPAFVLVTTTLGNTLKVGVEAAAQAHCSGGLIKSVYSGILSLDPDYKKGAELLEGCERFNSR